MPSELIEIHLERDGASFFTGDFSSDNDGYVDFTVDPLSITSNSDTFNLPGIIYAKVRKAFFCHSIA